MIRHDPTMPGNFAIEFLPPDRLLSLNDRLHWAPQRQRARAWRLTAYATATELRQYPHRLPLAPSIVTVHLPVPDRRRRDPHNYFPTVKPVIDGLVDAGLWPDDTPEWVTTTEPHLVTGTPLTSVRIHPRPQ